MDITGARRLLALWLIPFGFLFVIVAPPLVLIGRLPDPIAVHWGTSGGPDGSMPFWVSLAFLAGFWMVVWIALLVAGRVGAPSSPALAVAYFVGGLLAAVQLSIVDRNLNAIEWRLADDIEWWGIVLVISVALGAAIAGWFLGTGMSGVPSPRFETGDAPSAGLAPGDSPSWQGSQSLWLPLLISLVAFGTLPFWPVGLIWVPFVVAIPVLLFVSVSSHVDEGGLTVSFGLWGWPRITVPIDEIELVEVLDVKPMEFGGWGLRMAGGHTGVIVKKGPGFRVIRTGKRPLVVTCDDPVRAAGLLNDYSKRAC